VQNVGPIFNGQGGSPDASPRQIAEQHWSNLYCGGRWKSSSIK